HSLNRDRLTTGLAPPHPVTIGRGITGPVPPCLVMPRPATTGRLTARSTTPTCPTTARRLTPAIPASGRVIRLSPICGTGLTTTRDRDRVPNHPFHGTSWEVLAERMP